MKAIQLNSRVAFYFAFVNRHLQKRLNGNCIAALNIANLQLATKKM